MSKVLVCYVSPFDATAQIAMAIAEQLCRYGYYVDLRPVRRVGSVQHYCGVVVGGALSEAEWNPDAVELLHRCTSDTQRSVWLYHTGFGSGRTARGQLPPDVVGVAERVGPGFVAVLGDDDLAAVRRWATMIARYLDAADLAAGTDLAPPLAAVAATAAR